MKRLKRKEAEAIFQSAEVLSTNVTHGSDEMSVTFKFKNNQGFIVKYNLHDHQKSYFLK